MRLSKIFQLSHEIKSYGCIRKSVAEEKYRKNTISAALKYGLVKKVQCGGCVYLCPPDAAFSCRCNRSINRYYKPVKEVVKSRGCVTLKELIETLGVRRSKAMKVHEALKALIQNGAIRKEYVGNMPFYCTHGANPMGHPSILKLIDVFRMLCKMGMKKVPVSEVFKLYRSRADNIFGMRFFSVLYEVINEISPTAVYCDDSQCYVASRNYRVRSGHRKVIVLDCDTISRFTTESPAL